jgi:hypothetical protein
VGVVDRFDQYRAYIRLKMRTSKFCHVMFWFVMELALVNSWVLYKCTRKAYGLDLDDSDIEFRVTIVLAMVAQWQNMGCVFDPNPLATASPNSLLKRRPAKNVRKSF